MSELDPLFQDGPEGFLDGPLSRLRRFVCAQNGLPEEEGQLPPQGPYPTASAEDFAHHEGPQWQREAMAASHGLWTGDSRDIEPTLGIPAPQRFVDFERAVQGQVNPYSTFDELRLVSRQVRLPPEGINLFEQLLLADQLNYLGNGLAGVFAGTLPLGDLGDGDSFHLDTYPGDPQPQVLRWDHNRGFFAGVFSPDLQHSVFLNALCKAAGEEQLSEEVQAAAFEALHGKVAPSWHFSIDDYDEDFEPFKAEPGQSAALYFGYRARWIFTLLSHPSNWSIEEAGDVFYENLNEVVPDDALQGRLDMITKATPTALYSIWRAYLFDEPHLEPFMEAAAEHPGRIVQDAIKLIRELQAGRQSLGKHHDWPASLARFRALDLDPARAEQREAEAKARALRERLERKKLVAELPELDETGRLQRVLACFEDPKLNQVALQALWCAPEHRTLRQSLSLLIEGECEQYSREEEDMVRRSALSLNTATQLLLLGIALHGSSMPEGQRGLDGRKARDILALSAVELHPAGHAAIVAGIEPLDPRESLNTWQVQVLPTLAGALSVEAAGPALNALVAQLPADDGFDTTLNYKAFLSAAMRALGALRVDDRTQLLRYAKVSGLRLGEVRCEAALALASYAPEALDLEVCEALKISAGRNDGNENGMALMALARSPHRAELGRVVPYASRYPQSKLGLALLEGREPTPELDACLRHYGYDDSSDLDARRMALRAMKLFALQPSPDALEAAFGRCPTLDAALAEAAGVQPPRWVDRLEAEAMSQQERIDAVADPKIHGREACAMLLVEVPEAREALEAAVALLCMEPKVRGRPGYLHRYCVQALMSLPEAPSTVKLLSGILQHNSREHWDPILRDPPDWPGLRPGMEAAADGSGGWMGSTIAEWLEAH
ncbi:MAG: hypothetical protein VX899_00935 [Myxococcota bacterium]|nr:hypothetical protein [Myxococcota bacterium]